MKTLLQSNPILSFIFLTFLITFTLWFLPLIITIPKDIQFVSVILGGCGPLVAGYLLMLNKSKEKVRIHSTKIFLIVFVLVTAVMLIRLYFADNGMTNINDKIPSLSEFSILGFILMLVPLFVIGLNYSNATNNKLEENYLRTALFEKGKTKWYIIAVLSLVLIGLSSYFVGNLFGLQTTDFIVTTDPLWVVGFFSTFFFFGGNEEFGWRGFLQKELQKKYNPLLSSLVISFLWSLWHLPLYYNGFYTTGGFVDIIPRFIFTIPLTFIFTWMYNKSSYSLMAVILLHAMYNNVGRGFGSEELVATILGFSFAIFCVIDGKMWKKRDFKSIYEN